MISLGEELRREREFREISLREISEATKINIRILEAIETDNYESLPGGIFNRNFIRAYAQFIGLDPEIAVRKYQVQSSETGVQQLPATIMSSVEKGEFPLKKMWIFISIVLVIAVAGFLFWYFRGELPFLGKIGK